MDVITFPENLKTTSGYRFYCMELFYSKTRRHMINMNIWGVKLLIFSNPSILTCVLDDQKNQLIENEIYAYSTVKRSLKKDPKICFQD